MAPIRKPRSKLSKLLIVPALVICLPLLVIWLPLYLLFCGFLYGSVFLTWLPRGKNILFVYSNSPHWKDHIETNVLSKVNDKTIVLNWSERKTWDRWSLPVMCFHHFNGSGREFNPMAIVFRPFRKAKLFRFWKSFMEYKHGNTAPLRETEKLFFEYADENNENACL